MREAIPLSLFVSIANFITAISQIWTFYISHSWASSISLSLPELFLAPDDLKKLLEFEENCMAGYFRDKHESQHCTQFNRICFAAEKCVSPRAVGTYFTQYNYLL